MILSQQELLELYEAVVKPFGHPDPMGFMTRAILLSGGDPHFVEGIKRGFMPVNPNTAFELVGATEVQSLEGNVIASLAIDRINFDKFQNVDDMVISFHFENDVIDTLNRTPKQQTLLNDIEESRNDVNQLIYPPLATVDDVIKVLTANQESADISKDQKDFFKLLLKGAS